MPVSRRFSLSHREVQRDKLKPQQTKSRIPGRIRQNRRPMKVFIRTMQMETGLASLLRIILPSQETDPNPVYIQVIVQRLGH